MVGSGVLSWSSSIKNHGVCGHACFLMEGVNFLVYGLGVVVKISTRILVGFSRTGFWDELLFVLGILLKGEELGLLGLLGLLGFLFWVMDVDVLVQ